MKMPYRTQAKEFVVQGKCEPERKLLTLLIEDNKNALHFI
jgi:hypothetical protein